jgi:hypothetical protein
MQTPTTGQWHSLLSSQSLRRLEPVVAPAGIDFGSASHTVASFINSVMGPRYGPGHWLAKAGWCCLVIALGRALFGQYQLSQSSLAQTVDGAVVFNFNLLGARKQRSTGYACYARGGYWSLVH